MDVRIPVRIECNRCGEKQVPFEDKVPFWLIGAVTVAFHACHEGHPLTLTVDGTEYRPGERAGGMPAAQDPRK